MNSAHIHLLVNHIPVFGVAFGLLALLWSLARSNPEMRKAAILLFVVSGIFSFIALQSGERAEEVVEHLPGVSESLLHAHEEAAELANGFVAALAVASLGMAFAQRRGQRLLKISQFAVVALAVLSTGLLARAANLGGQIRHTEIRDSAVAGMAPGAGEGDESDEQEGGEQEENE